MGYRFYPALQFVLRFDRRRFIDGERRLVSVYHFNALYRLFLGVCLHGGQRKAFSYKISQRGIAVEFIGRYFRFDFPRYALDKQLFHSLQQYVGGGGVLIDAFPQGYFRKARILVDPFTPRRKRNPIYPFPLRCGRTNASIENFYRLGVVLEFDDFRQSCLFVRHQIPHPRGA